MAKPINLPTQASRTSEVGLFYREIMSAAGSIEVPKHTAIRVRAAAACTVTFDGVLSATMISGEVMLFNSGAGADDDSKDTVTLVTSGASFVQLGEEILRYRP
jgi:hypothetical protein